MLWDGRLTFSSSVKYKGQWIKLEQHHLIYKGSHGAILRLLRNLDGRVVPYWTMFLVLVLNVGNWFQDPQVISSWAHGWSNVVLEGRWWSFLTGFLVHSSKAHFLSNVILILFLGWRVEKAIGPFRFVFLILASMLVTSISNWVFENGMVVGASSIVFALWGAQIAIGLLFSLPPRHRSRYGWWGLLLLMVVFASQIGADQIAHSAHLVGLWLGIQGIVFFLSHTWGFFWLFCGLICFLLGHDISFEKRQHIDGMSIVIPKDFSAHTVGEAVVWFHPFDTSGWIIQGKDLSLQHLNRYWKEYDFSTGFTEQCILEEGCSKNGNSHDIILRIVHLGVKEVSWIACVYPNESSIWQQSCLSWIKKVQATEPRIIQRKRVLMERYSDSEYHLEQYALSLENWGYFHEADLMYQRLMNSDWKVRAETHRKRIQQYLASQ